MPEGHTIHRKVVDQGPHLVGQPVAVTSPNRRFQSGAARMDGRTLESMDAWGKNLFYFFPDRLVLHVHLGLEGRFRHYRSAPFPPARRSAWIRMGTETFAFDLTTPKVCRLIDAVTQRRFVARLGPDPIRVDNDGGAVMGKLKSYEGPIGVALLDQSLVAGIGNVYRAEILFAHGMHPERPASTLTEEEWTALWSTSVRMLRKGVEDKGDIITVDARDLRVRDGRQTYVYGAKLCARCGSPVRSWNLAGRVAYACETCQPRWNAI